MVFKKRALPEEDPTSLGNLLLKAGVCTAPQLQDALTVKRARDEQFLGEVMIGMGLITPGMLHVVLEQQELLRVNGRRKAVRYAQTAARGTMALSGSLASLNEVALAALHKLKP